MKSKCLILVSFLVLLLSSTFHLSASVDGKKDIPLQGTWGEDKRSVPFDCPISAFWDGNNLYVDNTSFRSDIRIVVYNSTRVVCEKEFSSGLCSSIFLGTMPVGETYQVVITNKWGDQLRGEFMKE